MEAHKAEYFIDGFLIKHFGIYPIGFNKDDLFFEQKIFLVNLIGIIPDYSAWNYQVMFNTEMEEIKSMTVKDVKLSEEEIDLARLRGHNLDQIKIERLSTLKKNKEKEIKEKYGVKEEKETEQEISIRPESERKHLWDILEGKGLIRNGL